MRRFAPIAAALVIASVSVLHAEKAAPLGEKIISEQWMEIRMQGDKIGFSYRKTARTTSGYRMTSKSVIKLMVGEIAQDISMSQTYFFGADMKPKRFTYMQKMLGHRQLFEGEVRGDKIMMTITSAGSVTKRTLPFDSDMQFSDAIDFVMGRSEMKEGKVYKFKVFMEPLLASEEIEITVGKKVDFEYDGKTEKAWRLTTKFKSFTVTSFVAEDGRLLKEVSPLGFETLAVDEAVAVSFSEGVMPFTNLLAFSLITIDSPIRDQERISSMRLLISGMSDRGLIPSDERQKVSDIENKTGGKKKSYAASIDSVKISKNSISKVQRPAPAAGMVDYLRSTFEAQSGDPLIVQTAKEIVGDEPDVYESAVKINRWVYKNVEKKFVDTFSAVATLKSLEGECQSHTNLFAAMAKSVGIPTRTVSGIVYSKQFGGFLYHAWPEIYAGKWIAIDPTLGQDLADATHVKLIEGELSKQLQLFEFIGKIGVQVISAEYRQRKKKSWRTDPQAAAVIRSVSSGLSTTRSRVSL